MANSAAEQRARFGRKRKKGSPLAPEHSLPLPSCVDSFSPDGFGGLRLKKALQSCGISKAPSSSSSSPLPIDGGKAASKSSDSPIALTMESYADDSKSAPAASQSDNADSGMVDSREAAPEKEKNEEGQQPSGENGDTTSSSSRTTTREIDAGEIEVDEEETALRDIIRMRCCLNWYHIDCIFMHEKAMKANGGILRCPVCRDETTYQRQLRQLRRDLKMQTVVPAKKQPVKRRRKSNASPLTAQAPTDNVAGSSEVASNLIIVDHVSTADGESTDARNVSCRQPSIFGKGNKNNVDMAASFDLNYLASASSESSLHSSVASLPVQDFPSELTRPKNTLEGVDSVDMHLFSDNSSSTPSTSKEQSDVSEMADSNPKPHDEDLRSVEAQLATVTAQVEF